MAVTLIEQLRGGISTDQFELSKHAVDRGIVRHIGMQELREAVATGEVIEDFPDDKYGPICLVFGETVGGRPSHVPCSRQGERDQETPGRDSRSGTRSATLGCDPATVLKGLICGL